MYLDVSRCGPHRKTEAIDCGGEVYLRKSCQSRLLHTSKHLTSLPSEWQRILKVAVDSVMNLQSCHTDLVNPLLPLKLCGGIVNGSGVVVPFENSGLAFGYQDPGL
ncbi:hypothetical protein NPIL_670251 [Nephila pilipes]|uniref:Uncharacterized protein n=1 Tax=Nephila pilipes TaxID=299642 RepID=A0A8X6PEJ8_NEPPI|nr:hypothetical protein NPIL_670251 [Nephila pilipes]